MYNAKVLISLKKGLLDPQGTIIGSSLRSLGFSDVLEVKVGKLVEIKMKSKSKADAAKKVEEMSKRLLANPVIETFKYEIGEE